MQQQDCFVDTFLPSHLLLALHKKIHLHPSSLLVTVLSEEIVRCHALDMENAEPMADVSAGVGGLDLAVNRESANMHLLLVWILPFHTNQWNVLDKGFATHILVNACALLVSKAQHANGQHVRTSVQDMGFALCSLPSPTYHRPTLIGKWIAL